MIVNRLNRGQYEGLPRTKRKRSIPCFWSILYVHRISLIYLLTYMVYVGKYCKTYICTSAPCAKLCPCIYMYMDRLQCDWPAANTLSEEWAATTQNLSESRRNVWIPELHTNIQYMYTCNMRQIGAHPQIHTCWKKHVQVHMYAHTCTKHMYIHVLLPRVWSYI